jgi:hypothetical protein
MSRVLGVEVSSVMEKVLRDLYAGYHAQRWHEPHGIVFIVAEPPALGMEEMGYPELSVFNDRQ